MFVIFFPCRRASRECGGLIRPRAALAFVSRARVTMDCVLCDMCF